MKCYFCNHDMIMSNINSKDEIGLDGQGNIILFICNNPECNASCQFVEGE